MFRAARFRVPGGPWNPGTWNLLRLDWHGRRRGRRRRLRRCGGRGVERANDIKREVHRRIRPDEAALRRAEDEVHALLLRDLVDDRREPALEFGLQLLGEGGDFLLRVLGGALD